MSQLSSSTPAHEVSATVDGAPFVVRCDDLTLGMDGTAVASAFLIPAMHVARGLRIDGTLSPRWLENAAEVQSTCSEWWGFQPIPVRGHGAPAGLEAPPSGAVALAFSGGVDSFYSLLRGAPPDLLLTMRGFDIPVADQQRWHGFRRSLQEISDAVGVRSVTGTTDLREHPLFGPINWERTHGGALAMVGHLLAGHIGTLRVAATLTDSFAPPWGSHPTLDPLWSSERMTVEHHGTELWRHEKLWSIQDEPIVQRHLRVCWENRAVEGNCSTCDKCVITMLVLHARDRLHRFTVFRPPSSFAQAVDALPKTTYLRTIGLLLDEALDDEIKAALRRLAERTRPMLPAERH